MPGATASTSACAVSTATSRTAAEAWARISAMRVSDSFSFSLISTSALAVASSICFWMSARVASAMRCASARASLSAFW